jgi:hypothetical protein
LKSLPRFLRRDGATFVGICDPTINGGQRRFVLFFSNAKRIELWIAHTLILPQPIPHYSKTSTFLNGPEAA